MYVDSGCIQLQMSITSLKVFESLLQKSDPIIVQTLVLRNLLGRAYYQPPLDSESPPEGKQEATSESSASVQNGPVDGSGDTTESPQDSQSAELQSHQESDGTQPTGESKSPENLPAPESPGTPQSMTLCKLNCMFEDTCVWLT